MGSGALIDWLPKEKHQARTSAKGRRSSSPPFRGRSWSRVGKWGGEEWEQQKPSLQEKEETKRALQLRSAFLYASPTLLVNNKSVCYLLFLPSLSLPAIFGLGTGWRGLFIVVPTASKRVEVLFSLGQGRAWGRVPTATSFLVWKVRSEEYLWYTAKWKSS